MGMSVSVATAILAIGMVVVAIVLVESLSGSFQELNDANDERVERERELLDTAIAILSAEHNSTTGVLNVSVSNTGSTTLDPLEMDVLADGLLVTDNVTSITIGGAGAVAWFPLETLHIGLNLPSPPSRVKVVTGNGVGVYSEDIISTAR